MHNYGEYILMGYAESVGYVNIMSQSDQKRNRPKMIITVITKFLLSL